MRKIIKKTIETFAWALAIGGCIITGVFAYQVSKKYEIGESIKFDVTGQYGDFIGGVVGTIISAAAFIFLYLTLSEQREAFKKERFENKFFELIKLHRDNINEMKMLLTKKKTNFTAKINDIEVEERQFTGREVIEYISEQIITCRREISTFFDKKKTSEIYNLDSLKQIQEQKSISERKITLKELARIDIAFCIVFFGIEYQGNYTLKRFLSKKYNPEFFSDIVDYISLKPLPDTDNYSRWKKIRKIRNPEIKIQIVREIINKRKVFKNTKVQTAMTSGQHLDKLFYRNNFVKYYSGCQFQLGHYFRHLYQTINYVNNQSNLNYVKKYAYVKMLRAQLSTPEQALFFFNSLSALGEIWELCCHKKFDNSADKKNKIKILNNHLITKYNLIKNLPSGQLFRQGFERFYPDVEFEFGKPSENRKELLKIYN